MKIRLNLQLILWNNKQTLAILRVLKQNKPLALEIFNFGLHHPTPTDVINIILTEQRLLQSHCTYKDGVTEVLK